MEKIFLDSDRFSDFVDHLIAHYRVFGPVNKGPYHQFERIEEPGALDLDFQNTRLSPKDLIHPQAERMFRFSLAKDDPEAGILKEIPKEMGGRLILGIRPCDAKALQLLDVNFDTREFKDPWWVGRRRGTLLVGLACNEPCETCFCTAVGTGPADPSALDVLLVKTGDGFVAEAVTEAGKGLLGAWHSGEPVTEALEQEAARIKERAEKHITRPFDTAPLADRETNELFNQSFWDEVQFACINCGTCTFLCPTCWCFDIQDEVYGDRGLRLRLWDSCMFPLFTLHGSGHNPRPQKLQRVRQRFMHKFKYYIDKYGTGPACVGCGRCVQFCPVNIDIRRVVSMMTASCVCPA